MCGSNLVASQLLLVCATPPPAATIVPSLVVSSSIMLLTSPTPLVDSGHVLNNPTTPSCVSGCKMYPLHTSGKWVTYLIACFHNAFSLFCLYCLAEILHLTIPFLYRFLIMEHRAFRHPTAALLSARPTKPQRKGRVFYLVMLAR